MNKIAGSAPTSQQLLEESLLEVAKSEMEKNAGQSTAYLDDLFGTRTVAPHLAELTSQVKIARQLGRELAVKEAGIAGMASTAMKAIKPYAGKALGWAAQNPTAAAGIGGAAIGALNAPPGGRIQGAAAGGAVGAGAAHLGKPGVTNLANKGIAALSKFAGLSPALARAGVGAVAGGVLGAMHKSDAERQGLAPGHHVRNALLGAAGGGALGGASTKLPGATRPVAGSTPLRASVSGTILPKAAPSKLVTPHGSSPAGMITPSGGAPHRPGAGLDFRAKGFLDPEEVQRFHVREMANSPEAAQARRARGAAAMKHHFSSNPEMYGGYGGGGNVPPSAAVSTSAGLKRPPRPVSSAAFTPTVNQNLAKMAQRGGRDFIKAAMQAEPGTPSGGQDADEGQFQSRPSRISPPAQELYKSLSHLSPRHMAKLQAAQPGT